MRRGCASPLCAGQRSVASFHLWQQNGLTWSKTEVPHARTLFRRSGCPNFCHVTMVASSGFRSGCSRAHGATRRESQRSWTRRVYGVRCTAQPYSRKATSPCFGHCSGWFGDGFGANAIFHPGRKLGEWACVTAAAWPLVERSHLCDRCGMAVGGALVMTRHLR